MASSGGRTSGYWKQLNQFYNSYLKSYTNNLREVIKNNVIFSKLSNSTYSDTLYNEIANSSTTKNIINVKENISTKSFNENGKSSYSELINALNSCTPNIAYTSQRKTKDSTEEKGEGNVFPKWKSKKREIVSRASIDSRTKHLIKGLEHELQNNVILYRLEDLCIHLKKYPTAQGVVIKHSGVRNLLRILHQSDDSSILQSTREALALIGYTAPVKGQGIRILSIDGGGTRGLVALNILRHLESKTHQPIYQLFDFVCGVSTGAVLAVLIAVHRLSLDDCEKLYRRISSKIFSQSTFRGTASLVWKNSFYDSLAWTEILQKEMGHKLMIETQRIHEMNKICLVSTQINDSLVKAFLFRNYNLPYRMASHFNGCSSARMWEGVRASAAAPGYFSEFRLNDLGLLDGGVMVNNPTAIAIHEARQLWPETPFQSIVSIGTGRHEPLLQDTKSSINWTSKIKSFINSATDTEVVHTTLHDLLPGDVYFRFNPYLSEALTLDEIREHKLNNMLDETALYLRKNTAKLNAAVKSLKLTKSWLYSSLDYVALQKALWNFS